MSSHPFPAAGAAGVDLLRYAEADIARRGGLPSLELEAPAGPTRPNQAIQVELHEAQQCVEFKCLDEFAITPHSTFVPFSVLEICYYNMLGAKLAPMLAVLARAGARGEIPGSPTDNRSLAGPSLHRDTPP